MGGVAANEKLVVDYIGSNKVMVFSKTTCRYCRMAKDILKEINADYEVLELDKHPHGRAIQDILLKITGARSVPRVFIDGNCIGGGTETQKLHEEGKLKKLIEG